MYCTSTASTVLDADRPRPFLARFFFFFKMAGVHEVGGNLFDIPPLDDFELVPSNSSSDGNAPPILTDVLPELPELPELPFNNVTLTNNTEWPNFGNFTATIPSKDDDFGNFTATDTSKDDDFGNFTATIPSKDDDFGNFTATNTSKDDDFGNFTATIPCKDDDFGNFTATDTSKDDDFGNFTATIPSKDDDFGNFTATDTSKNDDFGNFTATIPSKDDDFGNFTATDTSKNDDFGNFTATIPSKDDDFGNFTATDTSKNDDFGKFTATIPSKDDDFGNFTATDASKNDDFGNFTATIPSKDDDFGNFTATDTSKDDDFGNFTATIPSKDDDFGNFTATNTSKDDDFGNFDSFSSISDKSTKMSSVADAIITCFPINMKPMTTSIKQLKDLFEDKYYIKLSKETCMTSTLYQWNQSLLQDRFYTSLKVDPMLTSGDGTGNDPFNVISLLDEFGTQTISKAETNEFETGGATLLDLSLPMSPINKDGRDPNGVLLHSELNELDLNISSSDMDTPTTIGDTPTSWMDSELLELEKSVPTNISSTNIVTSTGGSNFDWLNNPELTTMVKPSDIDYITSGLKPTSSSGAVLLSDNSPPLLDPLASSPSPDPLLTDLIPPDPILLGPIPSQLLPNPIISGPIPSQLLPDPIISGPIPSQLLPDPIISGPIPSQLLPDPVPDPLVASSDTTVASQSLNIVMEMTNNISNSPVTMTTRPSLSPPQSSIDILEDQLLELTLKRKKLSEEDKIPEIPQFITLSEQAKLLLSKLPILSFMRRTQ